jgi:CDP-paratose 2-epimerase
MERNVLVTGGAGFIGANLTASLLRDGYRVTVLDTLSRRGSKYNRAWLHEQAAPGKLEFIHEGVEDFDAVFKAARKVDAIYHLAAQVAVTTSINDPHADFECNALGTLNVLEAARRSGRRPAVVFTSTNKVYGRMENVPTIERPTRYEYEALPYGVPETQSLDFHSPYGCSKGAADQYVRDYARIYGLPTVVFRMSCIYGPHQFGNEDQGWMAHFIIAAVTGRPITIYGDGKQVRDVLFVDDLVRALRLAVDRIETTAGEVFNIGGGPANTLSVWHEFGTLLEQNKGKKIPARFDDWRPGDQPCYVSDIRKAAARMGWQPAVNKTTGIQLLWNWVSSHRDWFETPEGAARPAELGKSAI